MSCKEAKHINRVCTNSSLNRDERVILRNLILSEKSSKILTVNIYILMKTSSLNFSALFMINAHFITYEIINMSKVISEIKSVKTLLREGSELNKRLHIKKLLNNLFISLLLFKNVINTE